MKKNIPLSLVALAVGAGLSSMAYADINDILITEYVEGAGSEKAIEISNTGGSDYTFTEHSIYYSSYKNEIQKSDGSNILANVTVPAGSSILLVHPEASDAIKNSVSDDRRFVAGTYDEVKYNAMNFNGDDSVFIALTSDKSAIHDIIGRDSDWEDDDKVYRRSNESQTPSSTVDASRMVASENDNDYTDLGIPTFVEPPAVEIVDPCAQNDGVEITIEDAQGNGYYSPLVDVDGGSYLSEEFYELTGIVTKVSTDIFKGFYLQQTDGTDSLKSDAIFVSTKSATSDLIGKQVCVYGQVQEYYGMTSIVPEDNIWSESDTDQEINAVPLERDGDNDGDSFAATLERYEAMLVTLPEDVDPTDDGVEGDSDDDNQTMRVTKTFGYDYGNFGKSGRNNIVLSYKRPNTQPNDLHEAGSEESQAQAAQNDDYRLVVSTDSNPSSGKVPYFTAMESSSTNQTSDGYIRVNDSVVGLEGVIHYAYDNFNILVDSANQSDLKFIHNSDREEKPDISTDAEDGKFAIKIASQNVLNYFNSPYGGSPNLQSDDNRGAEDEEQFERQEAKLVAALHEMDADVVGLMEIENNGFSDIGALATLVDALNAKFDLEEVSDFDSDDSVSNRYAYVAIDSNGDTLLDEEDHVGSDAITTAIIYRPKAVTLLNSQVVAMPYQKAPTITYESGDPVLVENKSSNGTAYEGDGGLAESGSNYQRNTMVAKFQVNGTGKTFNLAVNHFKSKGSTCWEDWQGWESWEDFDPTSSRPDMKDEDFQGSCENFRVAAAYRLGEEMDRIGGDRILLGDFNAYTGEDPLLLLTSNPSGKQLTTSAYTLVDGTPMTGEEGKTLTDSYGYINVIEQKSEEAKAAAAKAGEGIDEVQSWSYSYNDEVGSLDHILISSSLDGHVLDAIDWHTNSAESTLYDYQTKYKGDDEFYSETPFRSSDHDPAIMTLAYSHYEAGEKNVRLPIFNSKVRVTYVVPSDVTAEENDVATITVSPTPEDATQLILPTATVSEEGQKTLTFDVGGLSSGTYTFTMKLTRSEDTAAQSDTGVALMDVANSEVSVEVEVASPDSTDEPTLTTPEYDGTGGGGGGAGSTGILSMLGLLGLGMVRRRRRN